MEGDFQETCFEAEKGDFEAEVPVAAKGDFQVRAVQGDPLVKEDKHQEKLLKATQGGVQEKRGGFPVPSAAAAAAVPRWPEGLLEACEEERLLAAASLVARREEEKEKAASKVADPGKKAMRHGRSGG